MTQITEIKALLSGVSEIKKKYDEIAILTGENFNVFNILGLSTKEVRTHSAFIAELLNPKGSHGQGDTFLKLFVEQQKDKIRTITENAEDNRIFSFHKATVIIEESIGKISGDTGGRIDIVIKSKDNQIVIENKIYAGDEDKQLVRYNNRYPNALLLYLTLFEKEATKKSITKKDGSKLIFNKDYFNITYEKDIIGWLEECRKGAVNQPLIRETLTQYIYLIKQLTNQSINLIMKDEIKELLLKNPDFANVVPELNEAVIELKEKSRDIILSKLNIRLENNVISVNDIEIIPKFIDDTDGFQICFFVAKDNTRVHMDTTKDLRLMNLRSFNNTDKFFEKTGMPLCWKRLKDFSDPNKRLSKNISFPELLEIENSNLEKYILEIEEYFEELKKRIDNIISH